MEPDVPSSHLLDAVRITDRLRSPGGCPWDGEQTHTSLAPFLVEEAYETLEAIELGDLVSLREELGDLLFQVLIHARLAEESPDGFGIEDVAGDLVAKLVRRHPHVFAPEPVTEVSVETVTANWDQLKQAEKQRESATDGIPLGQPALALAAKLLSRSAKAGIVVEPPATDSIGNQLLTVVGVAVAAGIDPEQALRESARELRAKIRAEELRAAGSAATSGTAAGSDPARTNTDGAARE